MDRNKTEKATVLIGVGLDTARYGHHVTFLREDRQMAAAPFWFTESRQGYEQLQKALDRLQQQYGQVHFLIRIDAAGQYAVNLETFLRALPLDKTISVGEPKRNKDYKNAHFPKRKADPVESLACARFAVVERPPTTPDMPPEFYSLRELASALEGQIRRTTRLLNQLHNRLSRVFPEMATLAPDLSAGWVLQLLAKYPTPQRIAAARRGSLTAIGHINAKRAEQLQAAAGDSVGSLDGEVMEAMIRQLVAEIRHSQQGAKKLEKLLQQAYEALPPSGHQQLESIPGIGKKTAAALVAKIVSIDRFDSPAALVSYFGTFPEEHTSGTDKHGRPIPKGTMRMSPKGNDLVRSLLYMGCQSAIQCNPAIRALYARQRAQGKRGDVALGHCMRKMLHLVFAVWRTGKPFDPNHHPWETTEREPKTAAHENTAGRKGQSPKRQAVTAVTSKVEPVASRVKQGMSENGAAAGRYHGRYVDFRELRRHVTMEAVLRHLGVLDHLRGDGVQQRGPCPVHGNDSEHSRSFSVNLAKQVFRCFHPPCGAHGNVLDLWAAVHKLPLHEAALDLADNFHLPLPSNREEEPVQHI